MVYGERRGGFVEFYGVMRCPGRRSAVDGICYVYMYKETLMAKGAGEVTRERKEFEGCAIL